MVMAIAKGGLMLIKKLFSLSSVVGLALISYNGSVLAVSNCSAYNLPSVYLNNANPTYLVMNQFATRNESLPANFRVIESYHILASGQFSIAQFQYATLGYSDIIDIDLRGEYHGFINGLPNSFKSLPNDDINMFRTSAQITDLESVIYNQLLQPQAVVGIYRHNLKLVPDKNEVIICSKIEDALTESQVMAKLKIQYYRITELDHQEANIANLDALVSLYDQKLKDNPHQWVYLHCQGGDGRTTAATAALIMLKQADVGKLLPFKAIMDDTQKISNGYQLIPSCSEITNMSNSCQGSWQRYARLQLFYQFVRTRNRDELFSSWLLRQ